MEVKGEKNRKRKEFTEEELRRYSIVMDNPFLTEFTLKVNGVNQDGNNIMIGDGDDAYIMQDTVLYESDRFAKIFCSTDRRKHLALLSPRAHHLYGWIVQKIESGNDLVCIDRHSYMSESSIKRQETYLAAISDLIEFSVIAKSGLSIDTYWVNPFFFFKGNRIKKYVNYIKKGDVKKKKK